MDVYVIANWDQNFENNRTREMKSMAWVPVPNKMDGDGYTELLDHPDGPLHYAAWMALVLIASRCGERGTLLRSTGEPHDSASLARMSRIPATVFDAALPRLFKMGWLGRKFLPDNEPHGGAEIPQECAPVPQATDYRTEGKGTEGKGTEGNTPLKPPKGGERFESWWQAVHLKTGKEAAAKAYVKAVQRIRSEKPELDPHAFLHERMTAFAATPSANPPDRTPIHPATWLNQGRYYDDPAAWNRGSQARRQDDPRGNLALRERLLQGNIHGK
jgi:hypothetical protein